MSDINEAFDKLEAAYERLKLDRESVTLDLDRSREQYNELVSKLERKASNFVYNPDLPQSRIDQLIAFIDSVVAESYHITAVHKNDRRVVLALENLLLNYYDTRDDTRLLVIATALNARRKAELVFDEEIESLEKV